MTSTIKSAATPSRPSILKRVRSDTSPIESVAKRKALGNASTNVPASPRSFRVQFGPPSNFCDVLSDYNMLTLDEFLSDMRHARQTGAYETMSAWLTVLTNNVSRLTPKPFEKFVNAVLAVKWFTPADCHHQRQASDVLSLDTVACWSSVVSSDVTYQISDDDSVLANGVAELLSSLVAAHPSYIRSVMLMLIRQLQDIHLGQTGLHAITVSIGHLSKVAPVHAPQCLTQLATQLTPYLLVADWQLHTSYYCHLLALASHSNSGIATRVANHFVALAIERAVELDVHLEPKADHSWPDSTVTDDKSRSICNNLDPLMDALFAHVDVVMKSDRYKSHWAKLLHSFELFILPSHQTAHVQFVILHALSIRQELTDSFFDTLWSIVTSKLYPKSVRIYASSYIGSLVVRADWISVDLQQILVRRLFSWIHAYQMADNGTKASCHELYYSIVQAACHVLVHSDIDANVLNTLGLPKVVLSTLNPLRYINQSLALKFAELCRRAGIFNCNALLVRNARFQRMSPSPLAIIAACRMPFDPYSLAISQRWITDYRELDCLTFDDDDSSDRHEPVHESATRQFGRAFGEELLSEIVFGSCKC